MSRNFAGSKRRNRICCHSSISKISPSPMEYREYLDGFLPIDLKKVRPAGFFPLLNKNIKEYTVKISRKHGWKNVARCPVCSSGARTMDIVKFGFGYVCCKNCGLRYAAKIPRVPEDVYSDESYLPDTIKILNDIAYRKERFAKERVRLISEFVGNPKGKSLLDIGCGTGAFLEAAAEAGFATSGQDLGKELALWTSKRLGIPIHSEPISALKMKRKYDVITLFDVIEHVPDPVNFILDCKRLLKNNGVILIFTPNYNSLAVNVMKDMATIFSPADHLIFFTRSAVEALAKKTRLEIAYYRTRGIDMGDMSAFYGSIGRKDLERACGELYNKIQPLIDSVGAANHMRFILRKRS